MQRYAAARLGADLEALIRLGTGDQQQLIPAQPGEIDRLLDRIDDMQKPRPRQLHALPGAADLAAQSHQAIAQPIAAVRLALLHSPHLPQGDQHCVNRALGPACHMGQLRQRERPPGSPQS